MSCLFCPRPDVSNALQNAESPSRLIVLHLGLYIHVAVSINMFLPQEWKCYQSVWKGHQTLHPMLSRLDYVKLQSWCVILRAIKRLYVKLCQGVIDSTRRGHVTSINGEIYLCFCSCPAKPAHEEQEIDSNKHLSSVYRGTDRLLFGPTHTFAIFSNN